MTENRWDPAYEAIKAEAANNATAVAELAKALMVVVLESHPLDITLAAALFTLGVSGATAVLKEDRLE